MMEKYNSKSQFRLYFDTLPDEFNTGLSFGLDAIMVLEGCMLFDEITQAKEHLRTEYDQLIVPLCDDYPDVFPREMFTWENYLWACELWYSNSMKIMFPDGELRTCLVPVAGFLNHSLNPHITNYGKVDSATNTLKFSLSRPCAKGEECFLSYGNHPSSHLITFYGFIPKGDNPYDVFPLELEYSDNDNDSNEEELGSATHMARGTWFSRNHKIFHYGLPSPLLEYFRTVRYPKTHSKVLLQESLESEMEMLKQLYDLFTDLMEPFAESDLADSENLGWDVKLALEYKDIQRKILSSIVASCYSGLHLVKYSLYKCMDEDTRG